MAKQKDDIEEQGTTLLDFVIPQKIDAFVEAYQPTDLETDITEYFTDARLREFFKAWPCSLGDPLKEYLTLLSSHGFRMRVTTLGEPAVMAINRSTL